MTHLADSAHPDDRIADLVDFDRYPIADLSTPAAESIVAGCRSSIAEKGACRLEGFVTPSGIAGMAEEAASLAHLAHQQNDLFSPYIGDPTPDDLPQDHPRRMRQRTAQAAVAWDLIPTGSAIHRFYMWDGLTDFIAAVLGKPKLYRSADRLAACNLAYINPGDELGWHFDSSEFSITLQIQAPDAGGDFEFVPNIRRHDDENYDAVRRLLLGDNTGVLRSASVPGTLSIFCGHHSIHRVTPVIGSRPRISGVLTYADSPGFVVSDYSRKLFYGRVA